MIIGYLDWLTNLLLILEKIHNALFKYLLSYTRLHLQQAPKDYC